MTQPTLYSADTAAHNYSCSVTNHGYTVVMASDDSRSLKTTLMVGFAVVTNGDRLRIQPFAFDVVVSPLKESLTYPELAQCVADDCGFEGFKVTDCGALPKDWHYSFGFENLGFLLNIHSDRGHIASVRSVVGGFFARHNSLRCQRRLSTVHGAIAWLAQKEATVNREVLSA